MISPYLGYSLEKEAEGQRKYFRYFRDAYGMDMMSETTTAWRTDPFIGLQPAACTFAPMGGIPKWLYCDMPWHPTIEQVLRSDSVNLPGVQGSFCLGMAPWIWANALSNPETKGAYAASDSKLVVAQGSDCCVPLPWKKEPSVVAYSAAGCKDKTWKLPAAWKNVTSARVSNITIDAVTNAGTIAVKDGELTLTLKPAQEVMITADTAGK